MPGPASVNSSSRQAWGTRPSRMTAPLHALAHGLHAVFHLRDHAAGDRAVGDPLLDVSQGKRRDQLLVLVEHTRHVGQHQQPRRVQRAGHRRRHRIGIDVVGLAVRIDADRRDHRHQPAAGQGMDHPRIDRGRLADEAEVERPLDVAVRVLFVRCSLRARIIPPSLPQMPTARAPARVISPATYLLTVPASTISTTSTIAASVTRSPSMKVDWIARRLSIALICGPPPCTTTGLMPTCFSNAISLPKRCGQMFLAHRVAAVLHHHGCPGVAAQKGQGLRQDVRLLGRRGDVDAWGVLFVHARV